MHNDFNRGEKVCEILVVDDDKIYLDMMKTILGKLGNRVDISNSSYKALEMAEGKCYDIIFADYVMPELTGYELMTKIRNSGGLSSSAVIVMLSGRKESEMASLNLGGFDVFMRKPVSIEVLSKFIDEYRSNTLLIQSKVDNEEQNRKVISYLQNKEFDTNEGIKYARNSIVFYQELLFLFSENANDNMCKINNIKLPEDSSEYELILNEQTQIAKNIGAYKLYNRLFKHIIALSLNEYEWIKKDVPELLDLWKTTAEIANQAGTM